MSTGVKNKSSLNNKTSIEKDNQAAKKFREQYNAFINQLEMTDIIINKAMMEMLDYDYVPSDNKTTVNWRTSANYENKENEIRVSQRFNVTISDKPGKQIKAKLTFVFLVVYNSKIPLNDELFSTFKDVNLSLNTWPYFREFVHNNMIRMGWPPFIAPLYKA